MHKRNKSITYSRVYQYCVYTHQSEFREVVSWVNSRDWEFEVHLARTRFWVPHRDHVEFVLRWGAVCKNVDHETDHALGR